MIRMFFVALTILGLSPFAALAQADGFAGSYLAARQAGMNHDFSAASDYFLRALGRDGSNVLLMENTVAALVGVGRFERAVPIAQQLAAVNPESQIAAQILVAHRMKEGEFAGLLGDQAAALSVGPLVDGLAAAWAHVGAGDMTQALAAFDEIAARPGLAAFGGYHKALALANVGDFEGAEALFSGPDGAQLQSTRRGLAARAQILSQLERSGDAIAAIRTGFGPGSDPAMDALVAALEAGEVLTFDIVTSASDGMAEVFQSVASALNGDAADQYTLSYIRTADYLRPGDTDTILLMASLLEQLDQYDLATRAYDQVARDDPSFHAAEMGRAEALRRAGRSDAAIEVLQQLAESHAEIALVHQTLGDALRRLERYDEASQAYDQAVALHEIPDRQHWILYFARGITHERSDRWPLAEADFRLALELSPDQPQVLNYLGYSLVELRQNLDEALGMIESAVQARPDDGYITDSLGWVLYRLGRYDEAAVHMERAAQLTPTDPIISDHLGDVYWAVGRTLEARFQWRRAMSFDPEEDDVIRIRRKLEVGLDRVLEEEGAAPLAVANDGG